MYTRWIWIQRQQQVYAEIRLSFKGLGMDGSSQYCQQQKEYALRLIDEYGVRAVARILGIPRRTLQRWCREQGKQVKRCPDWVYSWAAQRQKRRQFWARIGIPHTSTRPESLPSCTAVDQMGDGFPDIHARARE